MKLYYTKRSPYARKAIIMAIEKNIEIEYIEEDLLNKSELLFENNPVAKVPVLILDNGCTLCDSQLICDYIESLVPEPWFIPDSQEERFRVLNLDVISKGLMDVTVSMFFENLLHKDQPNEKFIKRQEETIARCLNYFNDRVSELEEFTIASVGVICAIGYICFRFEHLWKKDLYPELYVWYKEMNERQSVHKTAPKE